MRAEPWPRGDDELDALLPEPYRTKAAAHFTPVAVARRAGELLRGARRVLDVGAGAGKLCVVAAAAAPATAFVGVEQRAGLVEIARELARRAGVGNAEFVHGDAFALDWADFDGFYLFNPFGERKGAVDAPLDRDVAPDPARYRDEVDGVRARLARARAGTRLVTYHGFGAPPPAAFELTEMETIGSDRLVLWTKTGDGG